MRGEHTQVRDTGIEPSSLEKQLEEGNGGCPSTVFCPNAQPSPGECIQMWRVLSFQSLHRALQKSCSVLSQLENYQGKQYYIIPFSYVLYCYTMWSKEELNRYFYFRYDFSTIHLLNSLQCKSQQIITLLKIFPEPSITCRLKPNLTFQSQADPCWCTSHFLTYPSA